MKRPLTEIEAFRAQELLLQRATEGVSDPEAAELVALGADDDFSFDLAAAAIDIATLRPEPMPAGLADKVLVAAGVRPAGSSMAIPTTLAGVMPQQLAPRKVTPEPEPAEAPIIPITRKRSRAPMVVAWTAAAAGIAFGVGAFVWASQKQPEVVSRAAPRPSEARAQLLATAGDVKTLAWTATPDPAAAGAKGDVVWSPSKQEGYMRFTGLAVNDPTKLQYQLWIFDKNRDAKFPVDGGVFDVGPDGEVVVKISAQLRVDEPVLFAVTVEAPGGVVVSKRERIVVTAAPPKTG
ncbi:MAG: anti-sigma factor [Kofleriaceae bacterium]